ncbi:MAG: LPXTG cell wall anchor domain-containing protein, partial [Lachnospiraceae bacterium]|nr:LPXTG cell wall anchor domain-containing protein [Lachnospiraceae bacterium]
TTTDNDPVEGEVLGAGRGKSPKTNDASNAVLWALVMGSSTLGLAALMSKKRREEEQ